MQKHLYWGVVIFGHFVPDSAFSTHVMLFVMVMVYPKTVEIIPVLNEMHTNSCTGPRLALKIAKRSGQNWDNYRNLKNILQTER